MKDFDCYGFEIDERVKSVAESRGIKMLNSTALKNSDNKYDYIILIDVFEHLKNPTETISLLVLNLKKKGKLIISTGYADAKCCNFNLAGYWYFADCVQHLSMIGNDYINYLSKTFNLKILLQKSISHYDETVNMSFIDRTKFYLKYKVFEGSRIINKVKILSDFIKLIPLIRKPLLWKSAPPKIPLKQKKMEQDHIILILEKQ